MENLQDILRKIPSVDDILKMAKYCAKLNVIKKDILKIAINMAVEDIRTQYRKGRQEAATVEEILNNTQVILERNLGNSLRKVVNATGIVLHTNLGRAPLSEKAQKAISAVMEGYSNLEYSLQQGQRGSRYQHVVRQLCLLTKAEDAVVVNNNAGAVLLVLAVLAKGRQVIISRGQLVEIGGQFRIPDVLAQSGAILAEVGATNKTSLVDYERAINENTAVIMQVHTSNYRIVGFTAQPTSAELASLAHKHNLPMIANLGGGFLTDFPGNYDEPVVKEVVAGGADIVTFSSDKLLGATQAGIIVGKKEYIDQIKAHPLIRALRIDKLCLAGLAGTLQDYLCDPLETVPVLKMLNKSLPELKEQAQVLVQKLEALQSAGWMLALAPLNSLGGGGTLPGIEFPSYGVSIVTGRTANWLEGQLRNSEIPILVRIQEEKIIIDVRCLTTEDMDIIAASCLRIAQGDAKCNI